MLLYQNKRDRFWTATQDEAKAHKREIGGEFEKVEVPSAGREALASFLNHLQADAVADVEIVGGAAELTRDEIINSNTPEAQAAAKRLMDPDTSAKARAIEDADGIADFILNRASVAQTENIMAALGTRFAELAKGKRS